MLHNPSIHTTRFFEPSKLFRLSLPPASIVPKRGVPIGSVPCRTVHLSRRSDCFRSQCETELGRTLATNERDFRRTQKEGFFLFSSHFAKTFHFLLKRFSFATKIRLLGNRTRLKSEGESVVKRKFWDKFLKVRFPSQICARLKLCKHMNIKYLYVFYEPRPLTSQ